MSGIKSTCWVWVGLAIAVAGCRTSSALSPQARLRVLGEPHERLDVATEDGELHDTCGALIHVGDSTSVPHLIRALKLFPDAEPGPNEGSICTRFHCVDALKRITGANPGMSHSSWKQWYQASPQHQ